MMLGLVALLLLHPLHTTHTSVVVQRDGRFTLEIRAFTDDLHSAATRHGGRVTDSTIARYVRDRVRLLDGGSVIPLAWDGMVPDGDVTRLRLHGRFTCRWETLRFVQLMQTDLFTDQVNVVQVRQADRRLSLLFVPGDPPRPLS
jgi:hypothetical protein